MAVLTRPVRRTAQPSGPAGIDWGNPLTRDLVAVQHVAGGVWLSRQGVSPITITVGTPVRTPNPKGVAIQHPAFFSYSLSEISDASVTGYAGPVTLLSVFVPDTTTSLTEPAFFGGGFGHRIQATYASTPGKIGAVFRGLSPIGGTNTLSNLSVPAVVISRSIPAVEQAVWVNGVKDPSTSAGTHDALTAANMGLAAARPGLMLNAFFKRALSDSEIAQISANPWQLLDPVHQRVAYDVGAGLPPDTTAPTLSSGVGTVKSNALIVVGATTNEANGTMYVVVTTSATPPSAAQVKLGQNNAGTAAVFADNQAIGSTGAKTFNATGLTQLTGYYPYIVHTDASGNDSSVLSIGLRTTYRAGATGQDIIDLTGPVDGGQPGIIFNDVVLPGDANKWFSFRLITSPSAGVFSIDALGRFTLTGVASTSFSYQLEVDGVDIGADGNPGTYAVPVTIYDTTIYRPTGDVTTTGWTSTGANLFGVIDEVTADDGDYITSPGLSGTPGPAVLSFTTPLPTGTYTWRVRAQRLGTVGDIRVVLQDGAGASVGASAWQSVSASFALYELPITTTGAASRASIEVRP